MSWQKRARLTLAVLGIAVAIAVYAAIGERQKAAPQPPPTRVDPKAIVESFGNVVRQVRGAKLDFVIEAERALSYEGGATKLVGVTIKVREREGRDFVISGREAEAGDNQKDLELTGDVTLEASDGFELTTDRATFNEDDGMVRAPGAVAFKKGRMSGTGVGMTYDKNNDLLSIVDQSQVKLADEGDNTLMEFGAGSSTLSRPDDYLTLERDVHVLRGEEILDADRATATLSENEDYVTFIELRGKAEVRGSNSVLRAMSARDIDLDYTDDGAMLERVALRGRGYIAMNGQGGGSGRVVQGESLDVALAPDGSVTQVIGRDGIQLDLPEAAGTSARSIRAMTMDAVGEAGKGLTSAQFATDVEYREDGGAAGAVRTAKSDALRVALVADAIGSAVFTGRVRFDEKGLQARGARAAYDPGHATLSLEGADAGGGPRVADETINIEADSIGVALNGHAMTAASNVKSTLRPSAPGSAARVPGIFKQEQPISGSAQALNYSGASGAAEYAGDATLWQGETAIRAETITLDQGKGNLAATGSARSTIVLDEGASTGRAAQILYDDAARRIAYLSVPGGKDAVAPAAGAAALQAQLSGPQGDLRAARIELLLSKAGGGAERLDGYDNVTVRLDMRTATGARLTYFAGDGRYEMTGASAIPVKVVEACQETTGKTVVFFKANDRIIVDGNEEIRTQTRRGAPCAAAPSR